MYHPISWHYLNIHNREVFHAVKIEHEKIWWQKMENPQNYLKIDCSFFKYSYVEHLDYTAASSLFSGFGGFT